MDIQGSLISGIIKQNLGRLKAVKKEYYLFVLTSLFYLILWVLNPPNKLIVASFILYIYLLYLRLKDFRLGLLIAYLASTIIFTGKRYSIELVPPGIFDPVVFPNGYVLDLIIIPSHILASGMVVVFIRDFILKKIRPEKIFTKLNLVLILFFLAILVSDLFGSQQTAISLLFSALALNGLILYFFLQAYVRNLDKFLILLIGLFSSFVVFQSTISFQQYLSKSPLAKNLESQIHIEYWGQAPDELEFSFRPVGTYHHANSLASDMVFWLTLIFVAYLKTKDKKLAYIITLGLITLVMTLSRSAWLGLATSVLTTLFVVEKVKKKKVTPLIWNKKYIWVILALPFLFYFFILPRVEKSIYSITEGGGSFRLEQVEPTLEIISTHPIFGIGERMLVLEGLDHAPESVFGRIAFDVHNWYLLTAAEHGLPAFIVFMTFLLISVKLIIFKITKWELGDLNRFVSVGILGMAAGFLVMGVFQATSGEFYLLTFLGIYNGRKNING